MEKRGELALTQVIVTVLAIVSFFIILLFIKEISLGEISQSEICRLSVLTRGTAPEAAQSYIPLKCQTQKTCLYDDGGKCKYSFAGEDATNIKLSKENKKAVEEVEKISAEAMYECWQMMGEGKIDLFHSLAAKLGGVPKREGKEVDSICVICSRIALDSQQRNEEILSEMDMGEYLQTHQPSNAEDEQTYLQIFTDRSVLSYAKVPDERVFLEGETEVEFNSKLNEPEIAVIFMQIKSEEYGEVFSRFVNWGAAGAASGFVIAPKKASGVVASTLIKSIRRVRVPYVSALVAAGGAGYVAMNVHAGRVAAAGYCGEVTIPGSGNVDMNKFYGKDKEGKNVAAKGCSMVQLLPYDANAINQLCSYIESSP